MFRPNGVSYATVIDAYSRIHDGPNAERALEMMKYRNDDNKVVDNDEDDNNFEYEPANRPGTDMDNDRLNDWASQGFEYLNRRPPRSLQPRFTNRDQLQRGSCFF